MAEKKEGKKRKHHRRIMQSRSGPQSTKRRKYNRLLIDRDRRHLEDGQQGKNTVEEGARVCNQRLLVIHRKGSHKQFGC